MRIPNGFNRFSSQHYQGVIRSGFDPPQAILHEPAGAAAIAGAEHLLDCAGRQIYRIPLGSGPHPTRCFTYYFTNRSFTRSLRYCYAFRTLRTSLLLERHGFPSIQVLGALKARKELLNWTSLLIAAEIECVFELPSTGQHLFQIHPFVELNRDLARNLGAYLAKFHGAGFFHGDLKTRHILVGRSPSDCRFYLVDLEKCLYVPHLVPSLGSLLAARDLIQLFASLPSHQAERKKDIFDSYFSETRLPATARSVLRRTVRLYSEQGHFRQGRTVAANLAALLMRKGA